MAQSLPFRLRLTHIRNETPARCCRLSRRNASTYTGLTELSEDVEGSSSLAVPAPSPGEVQDFNPLKRAQDRPVPLPPSRYRPKPPRYRRGPLHPRQPPKASDPSSREFVPGPFSVSRLQQTYQSTLAPDLLSLLYRHYPPGTLPGPIGQRLREWDGSSPYHKNRPLRAPRGGPVLPLADRPTTFRNIPQLEKIHVHSFIREASANKDYVDIAGLILQTITNCRATVYKAKESVSRFNLVRGKPTAVGMELRGETMYDFMAKLVEIVMPRIKEWRGISGACGDSNGNLQWGFGPEITGLFPEVEMKFDSYPTKMIPGMDITVCTTATNDADARLLLASIGVPFYGKHRN